jgi:glycosyltransferase involved in cell wall biosynthesis
VALSPAQRKSVYLTIPAYNEGAVIRETLQPVLDAGYSAVVVDDGSRDDTWQQLAGLRLHRLRHPFNLGQGAALQTAVSYALLQGAEYIVHFDADGQHDPQGIDDLLAPLLAGDGDVVLGSRFLRRKDWLAVPRGRRVLLKMAVVVNGLLTGLWLSDAHNGARAFTREAAAQVMLRENGFAHATEILQQIRRQGLRYIERPTRIRYTDYSQFKGQKASNAVNILIDLLIRWFIR